MQRALGFDEGDLQANREGRLSERQERMLTERRRLRGCGTRAAVWALVGSAALLGAALLILGGTMGQMLPYALMVVGAFLAIGLFFVWLGNLRSRDLVRWKVSVVEGEARLSTRFYGGKLRMMAYYVTVGGVRFQVQKGEYEAFEEGRRYRVYYVNDPPVGVILSMEG